MKKSLIWLLTCVMAVTFGALLYFQIMYLENMVKMRDEQFSEGVMRSLNSTSDFLERVETMYFLEQDINIIESSLYDNYQDVDVDGELKYSVEHADGSVTNYTLSSEKTSPARTSSPLAYSSAQGISAKYRNMQEVIRSQYLYQKGLLTEVILSILRDSGTRPLMERVDSVQIRNCLSTELANNGVNVPFVFAVYNSHGSMLYSTKGYSSEKSNDTYSIPLFPNTDVSYRLTVEFPTKDSYIFRSVRFVIPTLAFTLILLIIFLYTVIMIFRQKKLSEMKTDFINNMTHELKTPISTISLAGQMLSDPTIRKSPASLNHLSEVITDESKRLRFQVEKVLQMSVFDNTGSALKFTVINANQIINSVANTFKIKVEKYGGSISTNLDAANAEIRVDEMQFTNVIFNLLDNAVKYMGEDTEPELGISTRNISGNRLEIRVSDNGIGIKKEDLKRIFEKFYRVSTGNRHDVKGFGLGLAYVKKMITLFGGNISVESELGKGSTFIITLPLLSADPQENNHSEDNVQRSPED
ncbi:MAG: HAMP domain-containing histidine kinase [Bacteroidales bacterium]|nr:HAMP domain-containing histidine kinase [Bacteroidales bacterium]MDE7464937.1 HAMP domain-containing histidine kinase [Muribaculaceae bacterium]